MPRRNTPKFSLGMFVKRQIGGPLMSAIVSLAWQVLRSKFQKGKRGLLERRGGHPTTK